MFVAEFVAEFVAIKVGVHTLHAIIFKLRVIGAPSSAPSYVYEDNMLVIHKGIH